jgi:hypothetical protein
VPDVNRPVVGPELARTIPGGAEAGEPIVSAADGVKLCDGTVLHALCRRAAH